MLCWIILAALICGANAGIVERGSYNERSYSDFPCPLAADISPCVCTYADPELFLDCTQIGSDEDLASVFQKDFPVKAFDEFLINGTSTLINLNFSMNDVTFRQVRFDPIPLTIEYLSGYFFLDSLNIMEQMIIRYSQLTTATFPFDTINGYTRLHTLVLSSSRITEVPDIHSSTLRDLRLGEARISSLNPGFLEHAPYLGYVTLHNNQLVELKAGTIPFNANSACIVHLYTNHIESIEQGTFYDTTEDASGKIGAITIYDNRLTALDSYTFPLTEGLYKIDLSNNRLSQVQKQAFHPHNNPGLDYTTLNLTSNAFTTVDYDAFAPIMQYLRQLDLADNPLLCGCDMAWLLADEALLAKVSPDTTCVNGTNVHDLDKDLYLDHC